MSVQLTPRAIEACRVTADHLSINTSWLEQRYARLRNEYRAPAEPGKQMGESLIDELVKSVIQNPKTAFSRFFGEEDWEKKYTITEDGFRKKEATEISQAKGASEKVMKTAASFLIQDHPIHFVPFRDSYCPSPSTKKADQHKTFLTSNLEAFFGKGNVDQIFAPKMKWEDYRCWLFLWRKQVSSGAAPTSSQAGVQSAEFFLKGLERPVKQYFVDLFKECFPKCPGASSIGYITGIRDIVSDYLDGDWLGYAIEKIYLLPKRPQEELQGSGGESCTIS